MSEFQKDSLTLEETNKVRISLGLPPLQPDSDDEKSKGGEDARKDDEDDDPLRNQDEKAAKNYAKYQEDLQRRREEEEIRKRIAKAQNKRELSRKLRGSTLGEAEASTSASTLADSSKDTLKWLKTARKKAKENAAKRLKEETEAEEVFAAAHAGKYDSEDLNGLKIGHDMDEFELEAGGEGRVLTLKDSRILEGEDDELMDSAIEAAEKDRINAERKKGVKKYTGLDEDDDYRAGQVGRKKSVLSKYDNDVEGGALKKEDGGFILGKGEMSRAEREESKKRKSEQLLNKTLLNLDYSKNVEVSDYLQEGDIDFKKSKTKKKKRATARVRLDQDDDDLNVAENRINGDMKMTDAGPSRRQIQSIDKLIDDDDLSLSLSKARREKAKTAFKKMTPQMIAKNLAEQREAEEAERMALENGVDTMNENGESAYATGVDIKQEGGLVFDDTSEFVRNINEARQMSPETEARQQRKAAAAEIARRKREEEELKKAKVKEEVPSPQPLESNGIDAAMLLDRSPSIKQEDGEDSDEEMMEGSGQIAENLAEKADESSAEPLVSGGMAAALTLLRQQGLINEITAEQKEKERKQKEYDAWLATRRFEDRVREAELAASKAQGSAKDQATREYENRMRELEDAKRAQEKFKNYTPNIDIKYNDEFGRELTYHESWKRLSHIFHGKMPGQKKQEQRLQRIMDEKKREKMLAGDTPSGMSKAFAERAERSGQAHMILGVGSKNNAPQDIGLVGPNTISRPKEKSKGKEKEKERAETKSKDASTLSNGSASIVMNGLESSINGITSMIPRSTTTRTKAGFAPVKNTSNGHSSYIISPPPTDVSQPSKFKLAFSKRPATEQSSAAPAPQARHFKTEEAEG